MNKEKILSLFGDDEETKGHSERVTKIAVNLARKKGFDKKGLETIELAAAIHDVGKIFIEKSILLKPAELTEEEKKIVNQHVKYGYEYCKTLEIPETLKELLKEAAYNHHEKLDGSGYLRNLKGDEISELVRVVAQADIIDALLSDRVYRKALSYEKTRDIIQREVDEGKMDKKIGWIALKYLEELTIDTHPKIENTQGKSITLSPGNKGGFSK